MPATKAQQKAVNKYIKGNYDRLNITVTKGRRAAIEARAKELNESVNSYTNRLYKADMGLTDAEWRRREPEAD